jgi:hypothetical protein
MPIKHNQTGPSYSKPSRKRRIERRPPKADEITVVDETHHPCGIFFRDGEEVFENVTDAGTCTHIYQFSRVTFAGTEESSE